VAGGSALVGWRLARNDIEVTGNVGASHLISLNGSIKIHEDVDGDGRAQSLAAWHFKESDDEHPLVAVFDNGSGMTELSSGKRLDVKGHGVSRVGWIRLNDGSLMLSPR